MNKQRFNLSERFNNKGYGFKGGAASQITAIDQFGNLITGADILEVEYEKTSSTTWATKFFEVDIDVDAFYKVIDKDYVYVYAIQDKEYKIYDLSIRSEKAKIFEIMENTLGVTTVEITAENADIIATETEDTYSLKMVKFSYDTLADIKTIDGRKYNSATKEWIIPKDQKDNLLKLGYKIYFK